MRKILDKIFIPIDDALHNASVAAGENKSIKDLDWRSRWRINLYNYFDWHYLPDRYKVWKLRRLEIKLFGKEQWEDKTTEEKYSVEEILDLIDEWHTGDYGCELHEFLEMTIEEYAKFVEQK